MIAEALPLLKTIVGSKSVAERALDYLAHCCEMPEEDEIVERLEVPRNTARKVVAAAKLSCTFILDTRPTHLGNPAMIAAFLSDLKHAPVEHVVVLTVKADNTLIRRHNCSCGSFTSALVDPIRIFRYAIEDKARSIIVVHNHPSGSLYFSHKDYEFTERLIKGARLLNICMLDSILVSHRGVKSMRSECREMFEE